jgi:predicted ATPase/class 3 adenylate cyclase
MPDTKHNANPGAGAELDPPVGEGANQGSSREARHEKRILTVLSYDLVGSTALLGKLDIEDFEALISAFQRAAKQVISSCSGTMRAEAGDGGIAVFPTRMGDKDAASLAIRCGLGIVEACRRVAAENERSDLHVRVGVATSVTLILKGDPVSAPDNETGVAFAMAVRLQAMARPDSVFVSDETRRLARRSHVFSNCGVHSLKGFAQPERVWQALRHKREVDRFFAFGRLAGPLINRTSELALIQRCWDDAASGHGHVILIEGEAGVGKSRLLHEVRRRTRLQRNKLLFFQCMPSNSHSSLHPLRQTLQSELGQGVHAMTAQRVAEIFAAHDVRDGEVVDVFSFLLGLEGAPAELKELDPGAIRARANAAVRTALHAMCAGGPVILVVEDIHWIDLTSRQLLSELARTVPDCPALLIATTRPGSSDRLDVEHERIALAPLDHADTRRAIETLWPPGLGNVAPELVDLVERVTGGVPFFIEEVCQWLAENETLETGRLPQGASPSRVSVLESVLGARLESLGPARDVARAAAVAGNRFSPALLERLLPEFDRPEIAEALDALTEAGFIVRSRPSDPPLYGFRHALIQETIYADTLRKYRQDLHRRLYASASSDRHLAGWMTTAALAEHAERGGLLEQAICAFVGAGVESSSRSAIPEARALLEHAIDLCRQVAEPGRRDELQLSAMVALGPILTAAEGPNSTYARKLYEEGVEIARRRPSTERAKWFPIYWGWWFTGSIVDGERAQAVVNDLRDVDDPEVWLQAKHCLWAVEFNRGSHDGCIAAVDAALPLYDAGQGNANATRFGGHDARVCALAHRALSEWFIGHAASALRSMAEARAWARQTGHVSSITHACINEAMLHCYRRDFAALGGVIADLRELTERHQLPSLAVSAQIFEGWCDGNAGRLEEGKDKMREGLGLHGEVQTPEDEPVYCAMLAELLARSGEIDEAHVLLRSAVEQAETGGSRYWLAELHRRTALLFLQAGADTALIAAAFERSLATAAAQQAVPILIGAYEALSETRVSPELLRLYADRVRSAEASVEPGAPLIVNPEPSLWG